MDTDTTSRKPHWTEAQIEWAKALRARGMDWDEIADAMDRPSGKTVYMTLWRHARRNGDA